MAAEGCRPIALALIVAFMPFIQRESHAEGDAKPPEVAEPAAVKPGTRGLLKSAKGMSYFLRVPADYSTKRGARLIVFMHGSNMNGMQYLPGLETFKALEHDILACPNGEQGTDPFGQNNFTFESAPFIAEITKDLQRAFRVTRTFVGGHSQGGFLTYSVIMNYPDLYQGAFPMAGGCWSQNEPNLWEERREILDRQRRVAIAVIHGRADPVVGFAQGEQSHDAFAMMGFSRLKLFAPEALGHQFMLSPVSEAVDWLEAQVGEDDHVMVAVGEKAHEAKEWGTLHGVATRIVQLPKVVAGTRKKGKTWLEAVEREARKEAPAMARSMAEEPPETWIPKWLAFRRQFGATQSAAELVKRYEDLRAKQRQRGRQLFVKADQHFRAQEREAAHAVLREILAEAPASYEAYYAWRWLDEAKRQAGGLGE